MGQIRISERDQLLNKRINNRQHSCSSLCVNTVSHRKLPFRIFKSLARFFSEFSLILTRISVSDEAKIDEESPGWQTETR